MRVIAALIVAVLAASPVYSGELGVPESPRSVDVQTDPTGWVEPPGSEMGVTPLTPIAVAVPGTVRSYATIRAEAANELDRLLVLPVPKQGEVVQVVDWPPVPETVQLVPIQPVPVDPLEVTLSSSTSILSVPGAVRTVFWLPRFLLRSGSSVLMGVDSCVAWVSDGISRPFE